MLFYCSWSIQISFNLHMNSTTLMIMAFKEKHQIIMLTKHYAPNISQTGDGKHELSDTNILHFHPHSVNIAVLQSPWDGSQQKYSIDLQPCNSFVVIYFPLYKTRCNCTNAGILECWIKRILACQCPFTKEKQRELMQSNTKIFWLSIWNSL